MCYKMYVLSNKEIEIELKLNCCLYEEDPPPVYLRTLLCRQTGPIVYMFLMCLCVRVFCFYLSLFVYEYVPL